MELKYSRGEIEDILLANARCSHNFGANVVTFDVSDMSATLSFDLDKHSSLSALTDRLETVKGMTQKGGAA